MVLERTGSLGGEPVAVADAAGRVLAEAVTSDDTVPGFDNSAMDGYAVRAADTAAASGESPVALTLIGESQAGHPADEAIGPGEAIAISTGAMKPDGADAVVRVEDTDGARQGQVSIQVAVEPGRDLRHAGDDIVAGDLVLDRGAELGPVEIGVLASIGRAKVVCARRPQVAVLTTGDELQEPGSPLRPGGIRNSNAHSLSALVAAAGGEVAFTEIVADTPEATEAALARALTTDLTVISGGVSVGPHDHVRPALETLGAEQVFWGVALRPGKPTWFGLAPRRQGLRPGRGLVFGLPGNPVSAVVTFLLFVRPAIKAMLGSDVGAPQRTTAILDERYAKVPGRAHLVRCALELKEDGWHVLTTGAQSSHVLTSLLGADALAIIPTECGDVAAGERVEIELLPR